MDIEELNTLLTSAKRKESEEMVEEKPTLQEMLIYDTLQDAKEKIDFAIGYSEIREKVILEARKESIWLSAMKGLQILEKLPEWYVCKYCRHLTHVKMPMSEDLKSTIANCCSNPFGFDGKYVPMQSLLHGGLF